MQKQNSDSLQLLIVMPEQEPVRLACDSIRLTLSADSAGAGAGAYGIRRGHEAAILSLAPGPLLVWQAGELIWQGTCEAGFARVAHNCVTVVTESAQSRM